MFNVKCQMENGKCSGSNVFRIESACDCRIRGPANDAPSVAKDRDVVTVHSESQQEVIERDFARRLQSFGQCCEVHVAAIRSRDLNGIAPTKRRCDLTADAAKEFEFA